MYAVGLSADICSDQVCSFATPNIVQLGCACVATAFAYFCAMHFPRRFLPARVLGLRLAYVTCFPEHTRPALDEFRVLWLLIAHICFCAMLSAPSFGCACVGVHSCMDTGASWSSFASAGCMTGFSETRSSYFVICCTPAWYAFRVQSGYS